MRTGETFLSQHRGQEGHSDLELSESRDLGYVAPDIYPEEELASHAFADKNTKGVGTSRGALDGGVRRTNAVAAKRSPVLALGVYLGRVCQYLRNMECMTKMMKAESMCLLSAEFGDNQLSPDFGNVRWPE